MSNVFISFLGTGDYSECEYVYEERSIKTKYIQHALIEFFCKDYDQNDKFIFFVTEEAKNRNWDNALQSIVQNLNYPVEIKLVYIPAGKSENEIWGIFQIVYDELNEDDSVLLDITHGFRSIPMLGLVILNYAHYLKNVTLKDIYYGAFEARTEDGKTPIFKLTQFFDLLQWTSAADVFVNYGISDKLQNIVNKTAVSYRGTQGVARAISRVTETMAVLRGSDIINGKVFSSCNEKIDELERMGTFHSVLKPIMSKAKEKLSVFKSDDPLNFIKAVKWYLHNNMIPQALTMMQEGLLTCFMKIKNIDYHDRNNREAVTTYLNYNSSWNIKFNKIVLNDEQRSQYKDWSLDEKDDSLIELADFFHESISTLRNDVNHGGFNKGATPYDTIIKKTNKLFVELVELCGKSPFVES